MELSHLVLILDLLMSFYWRMFAIQVPCKSLIIATTFLANNKNTLSVASIVLRRWKYCLEYVAEPRGRADSHAIWRTVWMCDRLLFADVIRIARAHSHHYRNESTAAEDSRASPSAVALLGLRSPFTLSKNETTVRWLPLIATTLRDARFHDPPGRSHPR